MIWAKLVMRLKEYLAFTQRKIGIFLILFVVSFSFFGPFFDGILLFFLYAFYTYVVSSYIDRKIDERIGKGLRVSVPSLVLYGGIYLVSVFVFVLFS